MSKFFVVSSFGCGVGVWKLLGVNGNQVTVHIGQSKGGPLLSHRYVGEGIVDKIDSWHKFRDEAIEFSKNVGDTIAVFDSSGLGDYAEELIKAGVPTLGGGKFMDRLEKERDFSMNLMKNNGCSLPDYQCFDTLTATIQHVWHNRNRGFIINGKKVDKVYFKSNAYIDSDATRSSDNPEDMIRFLRHVRARTPDKRLNMLQECIDGPDISTGRWWNGKAWVGPYLGTIEKKKFLAGEIGPSTGCSLNAVWWYKEKEPLIAKALNWEGLTGAFRQYNAPPGWYDINAILKDGKAWFLEWTPRFGWDSEGTSLPLLYENLPDWFNYIATGRESGNLGLSDKIAYAVRLGIPPYPWEHGERDGNGSAVDVGIWGEPTRKLSGELGFIGYELKASKFKNEWMVAAPEAMVGLACGTGTKISEIHEEVLEVIKKIKTSSALVYRPDGDEAICEQAEKAHLEGFHDLPKGLMQ
jgi:hypothetical protein